MSNLEAGNDPNEYNPNGDRAYNQWTRSYDDTCRYANQALLASKPMKYYVNQLNSPQTDPFMNFTEIGNQKAYGVSNEYDRPIPSRLNPLYPTQVAPYPTSPNLAQPYQARMYNDTGSDLRWGKDIRDKKSAVDLGSITLNRWDFIDPALVQNAGQFNSRLQNVGPGEYYNYTAQNNTLFGNSAFPYFGMSSRNQLHNAVQLYGC